MADLVGVGPWGGGGGVEWSDVFLGGLQEIIIDTAGGLYIKSIFFKPGSIPEGDIYIKISLDWPTEYLVRIDGTHGFQSQGLEDIIRSLTFVTNENTYGPYGTVSEEDTSFTIPIKIGKVVGFHGQSGEAVDAIGIYLAPTTSS
ncbi:Mannose/glucose-specific lectin [Morella rubra]|uniref:Mannose/glucose-specific lectin n=1 Tax=Morella rubra TaxID=262757 RepID=A0A6A1WCS1_9ROSI|nr:Mannose/glucose-specific lectin [Morella rubra]